ncbi:DUF2846 domain-containing protein [Microbulbifer sp. ANSA003]|uniref:DUF2846 domain-containing protein n=1 Tax=unclassified Microbulbifer TaxID=2619833 RepID=UPI002B291E37|nr:DUF2846 domain-containing protein [Microbulbifer sp. MKSA007]
MYKKLAVLSIATSLFAGCASVPMESDELSNKAKEFNSPTEGNAGLYIYRASGPGTTLKKDIWVNDECVGQSAPNVFFYQEVIGDKEYKVSTESEFSPNDLLVDVKAGENYFIEQYIKMGVFVGGADLKLVESEEGKADITKLKLAKAGECSQK